MTQPSGKRTGNPSAPLVEVPSSVRAAAGLATEIPVRITHRGPVPAGMQVTVVGLDARWTPGPLLLDPIAPGQSVEVMARVIPERGALGASYPFVVAVEATPVRGTPNPVMATAEANLVVDSAERISMSIDPATPNAVFGRRFRVAITNPGQQDRHFALDASSASGASVRLRRQEVDVPAQHTTSVKGKVRIRRPSIIGGEDTHAFAIAAQGVGAPQLAEATVRARPLIRGGAAMAIGLVLVVALWASLAVVFIPKISAAFKPKLETGNSSTESGTAASGNGGSGNGGSGNGGSGNGSGSGGANGSGSGNGSGAGGSGNGGSGNGNGSSGNSGSGNGTNNGNGSGNGSGGSENGNGNGSGSGQPGQRSAAGYQLSGTVTGPAADKSTVSLQPVSLVQAGEAATQSGAKPAPDSSTQTADALRSMTTGAVGKVPSRAMTTAGRDDQPRSQTTGPKGVFRFSGIVPPGYYLLTVAKSGYQTQQFVVNSEDLASPKPMTIELKPGTGTLSGTVRGPGGRPVGAATVVVSNGDLKLQTSSVSPSARSGKPGTWSIDQLATPGEYLVTVTAPGFGSASALQKLGASGSATVDVTLKPGTASIVGTVKGKDSLGHHGGVGGITVTATSSDGTLTRTATTVTSASLRGQFVLPSMPTGRHYTLTLSGDGYLTQTREVNLTKGGGSATVNATLTRANAVVDGKVTGTDAGKDQGGLVGVGLTLTSNKVTMKTMTTSGGKAGGFRFTGVPPGTYVLTAAQFGRIPASTIVTVAAGDSQQADLTLATDTGGELPATAHIRGQIVDARTSGPLTCDRTIMPIAPDKCVATVTVTSTNTHGGSGAPVKYTATTTQALNYAYALPDPDSDTIRGLLPGLYTVTVSAPGYQTTKTHVQVAQGQTARASRASLSPLSVITGTVTTRVGTPSKASCVVAVPVSVTMPSPLPTSCNTGSDGTTCTVSGVGTQPCGMTSTGGANEGPVGTYSIRGLSPGQYRMLLIPNDPEYQYTAGVAPTVTIQPGIDGQFNAVLDRLGRIDVKATGLQSGVFGSVQGATVTVTAEGNSPAPAFTSTVTTNADGEATVKGLDGTYTVTVQKSGVGTVQRQHVTASLNQTTALPVTLAKGNIAFVGRVIAKVGGNTVPVPGVKIQITGPTDASGQATSLQTVTIHTDSDGCYAVVPKTWDFSPSADGDPKSTNSGCASAVTDSGAVGTAAFASYQVTVAVDASGTPAKGTFSQSMTVQGASSGGGTITVGFLDVITLNAAPVNFGTHQLAAAGSTGLNTSNVDFSKASLAPATWPPRADNHGLNLTPDSNGDLSFSDSTLTSGKAIPGEYTFTLTMKGFAPQVVTMKCPPDPTKLSGDDCMFGSSGTDANITLQQLPQITGTITVPTPLQSGITQANLASKLSVAWASGPSGTSHSTVSTSAPVPRDSSGAKIDPLPAGTTPDHWTIPVTFADPQYASIAGVPDDIATPGNYSFDVELGGYVSQTIDVKCGDTYSARSGPPGCDELNAALVPATTVQIKLTSGGSAIDAAAHVTLSQGSTQLASVSLPKGTSTYTYGQDLDPDQDYTATIHAAGYQFIAIDKHSDSSVVTCDNGAASSGLDLGTGGTTTCTVKLTALGTITGTTVWDQMSLASTPSSTGHETLASATIKATLDTAKPGTDCGTATCGTTFTDTSDSTDGSFTITGGTGTGGTNNDQAGLQPGTWHLTVSESGFKTLDATADVDSDGTVTSVSPDSIDAGGWMELNSTTHEVTIHLVPKPVNLDVKLKSGSTDMVPNSTKVALTDASGKDWTCESDGSTVTSGDTHCALSSGKDYLTFDDVPPGTYDITITFTGDAKSKYNEIDIASYKVETTGQAQKVERSLATRASTISGFVQDGSSKPIPNAEVSLCVVPNSGTPSSCDHAVDVDGDRVDQDSNGDAITTNGSGGFHIDNVLDGTYYFVITHEGYADANTYSSNRVTTNFSSNPTPSAGGITMTPKTRTVTVTIDGATGQNLTGATATLTPDPASGETTIGGRVSPTTGTWAQTVTGDGTSGDPYRATFNALPTGRWKLTVDNAPSGTPFAIDGKKAFAIPDTGGDTTPTVTLDQVTVTLTVTWPTNACAGSSAPSSMDITVTPDGGSAVTLSADVSSGTATAHAYLPPSSGGSDKYTWEPANVPSDWSSPFDSGPLNFTVSTTDVTKSQALTPPPCATITVNKSGGSTAAPDATVTMDKSDGSGSPQTCSAASGSNEFTCTGLDPSTDYHVKAIWTDSSTSTDYVAYGTLTSAADGTSVSTKTLTLAEATTMEVDVTETNGSTAIGDATVDIALSSGGAARWSGTTDSTSGKASFADLPKGTDIYITASKAGYASGHPSPNPVEVKTSNSPVAIKLETALTITVQNGSNPVGDASVIVTDSSGTQCSKATASSGSAKGTLTCTGLDTSKAYAITATWTDSGKNYAGYTGLASGWDATASPTVTLDSGAGALVNVKDSSGAVSGATVTAYDSSGTSQGSGSTDSLGNAFIGALTAGTTYYAQGSKGSQLTKYVQVKPTASSLIATAAATLADTVSLKVTVEDTSDSSKIDGASVTVTRNGTSISLGTETTTSSKNPVEIDDLPSGAEVKLKVTASGYHDYDSSSAITLSNSINSQTVEMTASP